MELKRKKGAFNAFDIALLVGILILIALGVWTVLRLHGGEKNNAEIFYSVRIENVEKGEGEWDLIRVGDAVYSERGTAFLGNVRSVNIRPHRTAVLRDGEVVFADVPERVDVTVDISGRGRMKVGDGLRLSDIRIAAGGTGAFRFGSYFTPSATVISASAREV